MTLPSEVAAVDGEPRLQAVDGAGTELRCYHYGDAEAPALVFIHGIQDFSLSLAPLAAAFRASFHVVLYDLRGHGDSGKPGIYSMGHHLADLHALTTQLELERPFLVGHSLGGQIACHYAGLFPEIPRAVVSIEGLGPPMRDFAMPPAAKRNRARRGVESLLRSDPGGRPMSDLEQAEMLFRAYHPRLPAEHARALVELGTEPHPLGGLRWKWDTRVQTTWQSFSAQVTEERWQWIECPVLLVTAGAAAEFWSRRRGIPLAEAALAPEELDRRLAFFRRHQHVEIAGAGHMVHYDAVEELIETIGGFLDQQLAQQEVGL